MAVSPELTRMSFPAWPVRAPDLRRRVSLDISIVALSTWTASGVPLPPVRPAPATEVVRWPSSIELSLTSAVI
jgi:hypothetical protein